MIDSEQSSSVKKPAPKKADQPQAEQKKTEPIPAIAPAPAPQTKKVVQEKEFAYWEPKSLDRVKRIVAQYEKDLGKKLSCSLGWVQKDPAHIMRAIARAETSGLAPHTKGAKYNNPWNLHPSVNPSSWVKRDGVSRSPRSEWEVIRVYPDENKWWYDLLYHIDRDYGCNITKKSIKCYLLGCGAENNSHNNARVNSYFRNLQKYSEI